MLTDRHRQSRGRIEKSFGPAVVNVESAGTCWRETGKVSRRSMKTEMVEEALHKEGRGNPSPHSLEEGTQLGSGNLLCFTPDTPIHSS